MRFSSLSTGMHCAPVLGTKGPRGAGAAACAAPTAAPSELGGVSRGDSSARPDFEKSEADRSTTFSSSL